MDSFKIVGFKTGGTKYIFIDQTAVSKCVYKSRIVLKKYLIQGNILISTNSWLIQIDLLFFP